jgi:hypothetical protein
MAVKHILASGNFEQNTQLSNSTGLTLSSEAASYSLHLQFPIIYGIQGFLTVLTRPDTGPHPQTDESSSYHPILLL